MVFKANPQAVKERREKVETLYGRGFSERAIAASLKVSQGTVSNDLKWVREENARWYDENIEPRERRRSFYYGLVKQYRDILQEKWIMFSQAEKRMEKHAISEGIVRALDGLRQAMGIVAPSMDQVWVEEEVHRLKAESQEFRQRMKITPLAPNP